MRKNDPKVRRFMGLEGYLEKQSSNILLGFQIKFWRVLENGTKIGYSSQREEQPKPENTFLIKQCLASESSGNDVFQLQTRHRTFRLRAPNEEERIDWIKGITFLKKLVNKEIKLKPEPSPTETTLASNSQRLKIKKKLEEQHQVEPAVKIEKPRTYHPEDLGTADSLQSDIIAELIKHLPAKFVKYNTLVTQLKVKSQGIFMDSYNADTYLLISPKSLYPDIHIEEENLSNLLLPPWLEVNVFYKILEGKEKRKEIFHVAKVIDVKEGSLKCSLKVNTGQIIYQFYTKTMEQAECLRSCLEIASINAYEVNINGKTSKRNFDKIVDIHETNLNQFQEQAKKIVMSFVRQEQKYDPVNLFDFLQSSMAYLREFVEVLEHKKKNKDHVILDMLKEFHEQVKTQVKLTWDSSFLEIKGIDILNILKKLSEYYQMMKNFIKSAEFLQGMKELSKIYVREAWKNFESIIINIVEREKSGNIMEVEYCQYYQTHGVTDLFKFIYNVFDLAYPHWKNKIHLHNVNRLMQRALQVFVNELKSTIDEEVVPERQLLGIANNYFSFSDYVKQFYTEKFVELVEKTHEPYDKIIANYKEVSMIVLQKISESIGVQIEEYFKLNTIQTIKCEKVEQLILKQVERFQKNLHMAFQKKMQEKVAKEVCLRLNVLVGNQIHNKKIKVKQVTRCLCQFSKQLKTFFDELGKTGSIIEKNLQDVQKILSFDLYEDIEDIMMNAHEPMKSVYLKILNLREDYYEGSTLFRIISEAASQREPIVLNSKLLKPMEASIRQKRATVSRNYFIEEIAGSDEAEDDKDNVSRYGGKSNKSKEKDNLISEGYLTKGKRNHKVWQKEYFRLKNEHLYIYHSPDSDRCHNSIQIRSITKIVVANPEKPSFLLTYNNLGKEKEIKLKAETIELRERWVQSIELERKRLQNQMQVKKKATKFKETVDSTGRKKFQMIIDYGELEKGKDYFSYSG